MEVEQSLDIAFKEELEVYDGLIIPDGMELTIKKEMENNYYDELPTVQINVGGKRNLANNKLAKPWLCSYCGKGFTRKK